MAYSALYPAGDLDMINHPVLDAIYYSVRPETTSAVEVLSGGTCLAFFCLRITLIGASSALSC